MRTVSVAVGLLLVLLLGFTGSALARHVFGDVADGSAHSPGIHWAQENGIVTGYADGTFRPDATVRRDQIATMLHRYDDHVDEKIAQALPGALEPMSPFNQSSLILDPGGVHVPAPVYVADSPQLRRQGLRGVRDLPRQAGMVFVFDGQHRGGFTMEDTHIPLSIAFFDADGTVRAVLDMEPCQASPCPTHNPGVSYHGALEVPQGRFDDLGLGSSGWRVDVPAAVQQ